MKRILTLTVVAAVATLAAIAANMAGTDSQASGRNAGLYANADRTVFYGPGSGAYSSGMDSNAIVGVASAVSSSNLTASVGVGHFALKGAKWCDNVIAIGESCGKNMALVWDSVMIGTSDIPRNNAHDFIAIGKDSSPAGNTVDLNGRLICDDSGLKINGVTLDSKIAAATGGVASAASDIAYVRTTNYVESAAIVSKCDSRQTPLSSLPDDGNLVIGSYVRYSLFNESPRFGLVNGESCCVYSDYAHAEGYGCSAIGDYCHSEGFQCLANGYAAHAEGESSRASGTSSHASGFRVIASGSCSIAMGTCSYAADHDSFVWSGESLPTSTQEELYYHSHGEGTYSIAPMGGTDGFYIGQQNLTTLLTNLVSNCSLRYEGGALKLYSSQGVLLGTIAITAP